MNDFDRIAEVIRYLDARHTEQPSLSDLAAAVNLSESHFHRLFHSWAGITPKDFLQCLTVEHAKQRLRESESVLDAALDVGLSGPGRLHDLTVTLEAASPGEIKSYGEGLTIEWGWGESPFGLCTLGWNSRGICHLHFHDEKFLDIPLSLRKCWLQATFQENQKEAERWANVIFNRNDRSTHSLKAFVRATAFQLKVWRALLQIPEGSLASYQSIAKMIGNPKATRAVGTACGSNPIGYLIPCHRVIRETGVVQGYRWGSARKQALIGWESAMRELV